jgi:hypothetical protein
VVRRARDEIERLCAGPGRMTRDGGLAGRNWTMRVPAEPTDSDLVFSDLCDAHEVVLGEARALLTYRGRDRLALIEDFLQRTAAQGGGDV